MSGDPHGGPGGPARMDRDLENLLAIGVGVLVAIAVLPAVLSKLVTGLDRWLLEHHILVPGGQALFVLPGMSGGPDLRRVVIFAFVLVALVCLIPSRAKEPKR